MTHLAKPDRLLCGLHQAFSLCVMAEMTESFHHRELAMPTALYTCTQLTRLEVCVECVNDERLDWGMRGTRNNNYNKNMCMLTCWRKYTNVWHHTYGMLDASANSW